jgi:predicted regulator of Ras-like GTPase activity (Roadblock/LC7/MglB family)
MGWGAASVVRSEPTGRAHASTAWSGGSSGLRGIEGRAVFHEVLGRVLATEGARCVLLAGFDGVVVAAVAGKGAPAPDVVAASLADLFRRVRAAHRDAGLTPPTEFVSGGSGGQAALREVASEYLLVAVLDERGSLGRTRFELLKAADLLEPELA